MADEEHYRKLERLYASGPINGFYRPTLEVREGAAKLVIPIRSELHHAANAVHGSFATGRCTGVDGVVQHPPATPGLGG
jgi:hypothetical protein